MTDKINFTKQIIRIDVLFNMLKNNDMKAKELYNNLMTDNNTNDDDKRKGFLFETLSIILLISKCLQIDYTNILNGQLQSLKVCKNINELLKINIRQGDNPTDISIKQGNTVIPISIKYKNKFLPNMSGVSEIDGEMSKIKNIDEYKIGLIVKEKTIVKKHIYKNEGGNQKILHDKVIEDKLLLDENDIINGLELFCNNFKDYELDDFIEMINKDYLLSGRDRLKLKLHQKMTFMKFIKTKKQTLHLVSHKPRSGKSITILNICKYLLENGINKILIMTSVPATIKSFTDDLDKYIDFKDINYEGQNNFKYNDNEFKGIIFCSVQYLKTDVEEKKSYLKNIKFDVMIIDECHMGSSTKKTEKDILNTDIEEIEDIRNNIKINIFASGTSDKTKKFYKIKNVYCWDIEDEGYMKQLLLNEITDNERIEILDIMKNRHGNEFIECYNDDTLNKDYLKSPTQVLMKHMIPENIITEIKDYNTKNKTNYGYSCSSIFALDKVKNKKTGKYEYENMFELEKSSDGTELLKSFFECIISNNKMNKTTIMKKIEETQSTYKSRISQKGDPKLFLMYLPTHTGNNNIAQLQITFKEFIKKHKLWSDYNIEYSNSIDDSNDCKEEYNTYIKTIMDKLKTENKKGCILLLGNKGGVGITYHECDVTISLDDGHNLDNQRQRYSRALTEGTNKIIGINVDMNIQRTYFYLNDVIHKHRINTKTTKTNGEILKYLYEHNIFLFNPSDIKNGKVKTFEISEYYNKEAENILKNIDDTTLLNEIIVVDDDIILDKDEIGLELNWNETTSKLEPKVVNPDLEGEQKDCPKGDITKNYIDDENCNNETDKEDKEIVEEESLKKVEEDKIEKQKRILKEVCKRILFPLLALLSRTFQQLKFKEMLFHDNTKEIVNGILKDKKIILNKNSYNSIIRIMENNNEIINNISEIYRTAPSNKIHQLISKHFIPSIDEKKKNAEIPTPLELVNEMLSKIPEDFWKTPKRVLEPCCGKGNFVMKIFEKFYIGLSELYPNEKKRCKIIITKCLYFADLTPMNVFITTEILKCEIQSKIEIEEINYIFNSHIGDTLELDINKTFSIDNFDAIIGNPPYNNEGGIKKGGKNLYTDFTIYAINNTIKYGYILYIVPTGILKTTIYNKKTEVFNKITEHTILSININECAKYFNVSSTFTYFLVNKNYKSNNTVYDIVAEIKNKIYKTNELNNFNLNFMPVVPTKEVIDILNKCKKETLNFKRIDKTSDILSLKIDKFLYIKRLDHINYKKPYLKVFIGNKKLEINGPILYTDYSKNKEILLKSNIMAFMNIITRFDGVIYHNFINMFGINDDYIINDNTDIYKYFNFSSDEIKFIEDLVDNISEENIINNEKLEIIQKGRSKYYLVDNKLYKINRNKSQGEFYCDYVDDKNIEIKPKRIIKKKLIIKPETETLQNETLQNETLQNETLQNENLIIENKSEKIIKKKLIIKKIKENQPIINNTIIEEKKEKKKRVIKNKSIIESLNDDDDDAV